MFADSIFKEPFHSSSPGLPPSLKLRRAGKTKGRHTPRMRGYPVRRGFSFPTLASLEYWITRMRG
jgi:hypothetical protein